MFLFLSGSFRVLCPGDCRTNTLTIHEPFMTWYFLRPTNSMLSKYLSKYKKIKKLMQVWLKFPGRGCPDTEPWQHENYSVWDAECMARIERVHISVRMGVCMFFYVCLV